MVSILTTAYNHEAFIAEALDSFLMQETEYPFEVIVHDDASTDRTAEIIRRYAKKYPDIIRPVYQKENQFSKGNSPYDFMKPLVRGKYIAQCEGDDFWCDKYKLQKQINYMELHPECSFCFCNSYNVDLKSNIIKEVSPVEKSRVLGQREMIAKPEIYLATAGTVYRSKDCAEFPEELLAGEAGDIPLRNFLMLRGNAYGFADRMVCYRVMVPGSWSDRYRKDGKYNIENFLKKNQLYLEYYQRFDNYTNGEYHEELMPHINKRKFSEYMIKADWKKLHQEPFKTMYKKQPFKQKVVVSLKYFFPSLMRCYHHIKHEIIGCNR